ncbi:MAG: EthD family reductase [Kofleriaceae bacterium]
MIKVNVMYPYRDGARFDHAYYRDHHMPMMKAILGDACAYYTVDKGLTGRTPGEPPMYVAKCAFICASIEAYEAAVGPRRADVMADIPKYTDIVPVVQVSEIVVGH